MVARIPRHLLVLATSLLILTCTRINAHSESYVSNQVLVKFASGATVACRDSSLAMVGGSISDSLALVGVYVVTLADTSVVAAVATLKGRSCVVDATPNFDDCDLMTPNDSLFSQSWHLSNTGQSGGTVGADIEALHGWGYLTSSPNVIVGHLDTGIAYTLPDIVNNIWTNSGETPGNGIDDDGNGYVDDVHGWDFVNNDNDPWDDYPHGTATASVLAAQGNDSIGCTGVTWSLRVIPIKIIGGSGSLPISGLINGIYYAIKMGATVMTNSYRTGNSPNVFVAAAIESAQAHDVLFVAGAGNDGGNNDALSVYPASYSMSNVLAVGMTDRVDSMATPTKPCSNGTKSNWGATSVDMAAPGCEVCCMFPLGYSCGSSGTSLACPGVAGVAALLRAQHPTWTYGQVKDRLMATTDTLPSLSGRMVSNGRLNMGRALDNIPPSAVTFSVERGRHSLKVMWTDTGDDTTDGTATVYDFRWSDSTALTNETAFNAADPIELGAPGISGTNHCMVFDNLTSNHAYYFAMRMEDGEFNWSSIGSLSTSTLSSGNVEVEDCPAPYRPAGAIAQLRPTDGESPTVEWALEGARPNPTTGQATIQYSVKAPVPVRIALYDVAGRLVRTLFNGPGVVGAHVAVWNGKADSGDLVRSGVYYCRMVAGGWRSSRQLVLISQ